jgi:putative oxidoreductase
MRTAALFFMRLLLGLIFFWQGFGKVFSWKISGVYENFFSPYESTILPEWFLWLTAYYTSFAELICGVLLILGLWRKPAYLLLGTVLIIVAFGHGMQDYIWDAKYVMHRALILIPLMLLPSEWDRWSLDQFIKNR